MKSYRLKGQLTEIFPEESVKVSSSLVMTEGFHQQLPNFTRPNSIDFSKIGNLKLLLCLIFIR